MSRMTDPGRIVDTGPQHSQDRRAVRTRHRTAAAGVQFGAPSAGSGRQPVRRRLTVHWDLVACRFADRVAVTATNRRAWITGLARITARLAATTCRRPSVPQVGQTSDLGDRMRGAGRPAQAVLSRAPVTPAREAMPGRADSTRVRDTPDGQAMTRVPATSSGTASRLGATVPMPDIGLAARGRGPTVCRTAATQGIVDPMVSRMAAFPRKDLGERVTARRECQTAAIRQRVIQRGRACDASRVTATSGRPAVISRIRVGTLGPAGQMNTGKVAGLSRITAQTAEVSPGHLRDIRRTLVMVAPMITRMVTEIGRISDMTLRPGISQEDPGNAATGARAASRVRPTVSGTGEPHGARKAAVTGQDPQHLPIPRGRTGLVTRRGDLGRGQAVTAGLGRAERGLGRPTLRTDTRLVNPPRTATAPTGATGTPPTSRVTRTRQEVTAAVRTPKSWEPVAIGCAVSQARTLVVAPQRRRAVRSTDPVRPPPCRQARRPVALWTPELSWLRRARRARTHQLAPMSRRSQGIRYRRARPG